MRLTLCALPPEYHLHAQLLTDAAQLQVAEALLLPHDEMPVADLRQHPQRWAQLAWLGKARAAGLPILAWGSGAALLGRAAGGQVSAAQQSGDLRWHVKAWWEPAQTHLSGEVCLSARGLDPLASLEDTAALWRLGSALAYAPSQVSPAQLTALLSHLNAPLRLPSTQLEAVGGPKVLNTLLRDFYARCREDALLGPVFAAHVHDWPTHMKAVERFWQTMLGDAPRGSGSGPWKGNLNTVHAPLGLHSAHLQRWLDLFDAACGEHLTPQAAQTLSQRARAMGARLGQRPPPPSKA